MTTAAEIEKWADGQDWGRLRAVVVCGIWKIRAWEILRRYRSDLFVLLYEPTKAEAEAAVMVAQEEQILGLSISWTPRGLQQAVSSFWTPDWNAAIIGDPILVQNHHKRMMEAIELGIRDRLCLETTIRSNAQEWTKIGLDVAKRLPGLPLLSTMPQCLPGVPAIICGAGPSLEAAIPLLLRAKGHAAIVATGSSVGTLQDHGVEPDVVVVVEANPISTVNVCGLDAWRKAIVVPGTHACRETWESPCVATIPALQPIGAVGNALVKSLGIPCIQTGGSVSTLAYQVARQFGCSPVILVGVDCGTNTKVWYADGVRHRADTGIGQGDTIRLPAWGCRGEVESDQVLDIYRGWFESQTVVMHDIINASVGGARIAGTAEIHPDKIDTSGWPSLNVQDAILSATEHARRLSADEIVGVLDRELAESAEYAIAVDGIEDETKALRERLMKVAIEYAPRNSLLSEASISSLDDAARIPRGEQLASMASLFGLVNSTWAWLSPMLRSTIDELRQQSV